MLTMGVDQAKGLFFDRPAVINAVDRKKIKPLEQAGKAVMGKSRGLMRTSKKSAKPGRPPRKHVGLMGKFLFYVYDPITGTVVIGPAKIRTPNETSTNVPELMEFGGTVTKTYKRKPPKRLEYHEHPFMAPGLKLAMPKIPEQFRDMIHR